MMTKREFWDFLNAIGILDNDYEKDYVENVGK